MTTRRVLIGILTIFMIWSAAYCIYEFQQTQSEPEFHALGVGDGSLGIDRQTIIRLLDDDGFYFERSESIAGEETYMGKGSLSQEYVILIGPEHNLKKVTYFATMVGTPTELGMRNVQRLFLLNIILPDWHDAADWLSAHFIEVRRGDPAIVTVDGIKVTLEYYVHDDVGSYILTFNAE